jgi:hypothetical protein
LNSIMTLLHKQFFSAGRRKKARCRRLNWRSLLTPFPP